MLVEVEHAQHASALCCFVNEVTKMSCTFVLSLLCVNVCFRNCGYKCCLFPCLQADKRAHHNALERKRRDHIKDSFHSLRDSVPALQGEKVS